MLQDIIVLLYLEWALGFIWHLEYKIIVSTLFKVQNFLRNTTLSTYKAKPNLQV